MYEDLTLISQLQYFISQVREGSAATLGGTVSDRRRRRIAA